MNYTWEREGKQYHIQRWQEPDEVRISVIDNQGYPCHEQVVLPLAIWEAMAYLFVAEDHALAIRERRNER